MNEKREEIKMRFGENLKKLRTRKKLSQEELAEKIGVSRQSVSKWETGEAYPEMNNILTLCKIFHCHINDLVNDTILDSHALDEEIKENVVKLKEEQQKKMKGLSKAIYILAKICKIVVAISIPIVVVFMIILGMLTSKINIVGNEIGVEYGENKITLITIEDHIQIKANDKVIEERPVEKTITQIQNILENNSKEMFIGYIETGFAFLIISLVFICKMLKALENLFKNIYEGDTPFTLENVGYIKKMAYLMIAVTILPSIAGTIFELILKVDLDIGFELFSFIEILFLFSIAYIFQYGYEIQLDSKGKMYGKE